MERNKVVQELANKRIVVESKYYIMETSPLCPDPLPEPHVSYSEFQNKTNKTEAGNTSSDDPIFKIEIGHDVPQKLKEKLIAIHKNHNQVFDGDITEGYNGFSPC